MKINPVKGRPMLQWVGKRPIEEVSYYPAQLVETYNTKTPPPFKFLVSGFCHRTESDFPRG